MTLIYIRLGSLTLSLTTLAFSQLATYVLAEPILICKKKYDEIRILGEINRYKCVNPSCPVYQTWGWKNDCFWLS